MMAGVRCDRSKRAISGRIYVARLDLKSYGFDKATPKDTGRPFYDPADLLKLYIYGYFQRIRSSRRLETEGQRNVEVMWLLKVQRRKWRWR